VRWAQAWRLRWPYVPQTLTPNIGGEGGWTGLEGTRDKVGPFTINRSFDSGYNIGARAGYQMGPWRFEGEYSHRSNGSNLTRFASRFNGSVDTDSFMANGIYDFNVGWALTPHIGMGIGGTTVSDSLNAPILGYRSRSSDTVFSYQAIAGIRYMINPALALDVDYRYRGSADVTYHARAFTVGGVAFPARNYTSSVNSNNLVASLTWLFAAAPALPPPLPPPPPPPLARQVFLVFFDWDRDTVTSEGRAVIQQAATVFRSGAPVQIQVTGYTDRSGSPGYNQRLSERRANNVAKVLAGMGVPQSQMAVSGRGENDNRVPTANGVREPQNRRVEITS
jgi:OmpA-OmpF porin, OOP family